MSEFSITLTGSLAESLRDIAQQENRSVDDLLSAWAEKYRTSSPKPATTDNVRYEVTAQSLNVRSAPSFKANVIASLKEGQVVDRLSTSQDEYWFEIQTETGLKGWCAHKYLAQLGDKAVSETGDFPWLEIAIREIGQKVVPDPGENPRILEYLSSTSLKPSAAQSDETSWCSAFVNWCMEKAGYEGTDNALARSWLQWGQAVEQPRRGCVVILNRECDPPTRTGCGHVGLYISETGTEITLLGGNQSDAVMIKSYDKKDVLGYRLPGHLPA